MPQALTQLKRHRIWKTNITKRHIYKAFASLFSHMNWGVMAGHLGWGIIEEEGWRKGPWTAEEDRLLIEYVRLHGEGRWNSVARLAGK